MTLINTYMNIKINGIGKYHEEIKEQQNKKVAEYLLNPTKCIQCGKPFPYEKRKGYKFCGHICSAICNNKKRITIKGELKSTKCIICGMLCLISKHRQNKFALCPKCKLESKRKYTNYSYIDQTCTVCGKIFNWRKVRKTCSTECESKKQSETGRKSAFIQNETRRGKNEIHFSELCKTIYKDVLCNIPMFNKWDADVILPNEKIAVLWDGIWHHKKCAKKHSLERTQMKDKIKRHEIENAGYIPYVINDFGPANPKFVLEQFEIFKTKYPPIL